MKVIAVVMFIYFIHLFHYFMNYLKSDPIHLFPSIIFHQKKTFDTVVNDVLVLPM